MIEVPGKLKASLISAAITFIGFCFFVSTLYSSQRVAGASDSTTIESVSALQLDNCADCHKKRDSEILSLYSKSAHASAKITCNRCHGGDLLAVEKEKAHSGNFAGAPDPNQIISMCGACHRPQAAMFKEGAHFPERQGQPRLDCTQCHGAHTVGSPTRNFSFAYFCAGCHGLEYLPALPQSFQQMLKTADDVTDITKSVASSGGALSEEAGRMRREIRRRIAEIVHPTDLKSGSEKIPEILRLGEQFKKNAAQK